MTNTYTWNILRLDAVPQIDGRLNVVRDIHWEVVGSDGANSVRCSYGCQRVQFDPAAQFTPFESLTAEQVTDWLLTEMGTDLIALVLADVDSLLEAQANPPVVSPPLPWTV